MLEGMTWSWRGRLRKGETNHNPGRIKGNTCPFITKDGGCSVRLTRDYFSRICKTTAHLNCHHYCKRLDELKTPMEWLQRIAVASDLQQVSR